MKKWISLLLCLVMALSLLPAVFADEAPEEPAVTEPADEVETTDPAEEPAEEATDPAVEPAEEATDPAEEPEESGEEPEKPEEGTETLNPEEDEEKAVININATNFPDAKFRNWVIQNIAGGNTTMTPPQADAVDKIDCSGKGISSLKGIALFKNLTILCCNDNSISNLDLSGNKKLEQVECKNNSLTKLNVSGCSELTLLNCTGNSIGTLTLTSNKKLTELYASNNKLTKLNTDKVTTLEVVYATNNSLSTLGNIKNNVNMRSLSVNSNKLTVLELEKLTNLETLYAANNKLSKLDLTKNTQLVDVNLKSNNLKELDLSKNTMIKTLDLTSNSITKLDPSKCTDLEKLQISGNGLKSIDLTQCTKLTEFNGENNALKVLDLSANTKLATLKLADNSIGTLDLSSNTDLINVYLSGNKLCTLDVSAQTKMRNLNCANNRIYDLDVSYCTALENLDCRSNKIENIDLSGSAKLRKLYCQDNRLEELDPSACTDLETLNCANNYLKALHLTSNAKLADSTISPQIVADRLEYNNVGGKYEFDMSTFLPLPTDISDVKPYSSAFEYDSSTGKMTMPSLVSEFKYYFDTGKGDMTVTVLRSFVANFTLEFASGAVELKNGESYVLYTGGEVRPAFVVKTDGGDKVPEYYYDCNYIDNVDPGLATLEVNMKGHTTTKELTFRIYLTGPETMTIANTSTGIELNWDAVDGAVGYVVYRRAWSGTTGGWTIFDRWNNTTGTTFTDTKVYAGTRYQYGVKAYFTDPYTGLGIVGVLKTTVRITTRTLNGVTAGVKQITGTWSKSSVFTGYQLEVATDAAFTKDIKAVKFGDWSIGKGTIKGLKDKTTYYVRVRSYHVFEGMTYFGEWSNVMPCTTK